MVRIKCKIIFILKISGEFCNLKTTGFNSVPHFCLKCDFCIHQLEFFAFVSIFDKFNLSGSKVLSNNDLCSQGISAVKIGWKSMWTSSHCVICFGTTITSYLSFKCSIFGREISIFEMVEFWHCRLLIVL